MNDIQDARDGQPQDTPPGGQAQAFDVSGPLDVRVTLDYGLVRIAARPTARATVRTTPAISSRQHDVEAAQNVRISLGGDLLDVRGTASGWRRFVRPGAAEVLVEVPEGSRVTVTSGYAEVDVTGSVGRCVVQSTGGDIRVEEATSAQVETKYGSATVDRLSDGGRVESTHGSVRLRRTAGTTLLSASSADVVVGRATGELTLRNIYGTVTVGELVTGSCTVTTSYGAVDVGIPAGTAAYLDLHSDHGRVRSELSAAAEPGPTMDRASVQARTSYGDITIRRA